MSCAPDLVEDEEQHYGHTAPDKNDLFLSIVPDDRDITVHVWIPIEKLMSPAPDENPGKDKENHTKGESNSQGRRTGWLNCRHERGYLISKKRVHFDLLQTQLFGTWTGMAM
jgi:hypothetical protein